MLAVPLEELRDVRNTLVVWRLDRLGRSLRHLIELIAELERRQLGFRSLTEGIDTTASSGRLVFHIFGAIAEFERQLIRERMQAGLKAARARGRLGGRRTVVTDERKVARRPRRARRWSAHDATDRRPDRRRPRHVVSPPRARTLAQGGLPVVTEQERTLSPVCRRWFVACGVGRR
jgi:hypothetical protein